MKNQFYPLLLLLLLSIGACKKDKEEQLPEPQKYRSTSVAVTYQVDGVPLAFDTMAYVNAAGNIYEVMRMEYYISNVTFYNANGKGFTSSKIVYMNARLNNKNVLKLDSVPEGNYTKMTFNIGLDSIHNISYSLPNTTENVNMAWPVPMGGGYHFMKFEGNYLVNMAKRGYSVHLGRNPSLVTCTINAPFAISASQPDLAITMNINEWFRNPVNYDFNTDGYAIMGNPTAQLKIATNGQDIFKFK